MKISDFIARIVTERRAYVWLSVIVLAVVCATIFVSRIALDSDVLNMLPGQFESVTGLKIYDRGFEQTRELTFALQCQPNDVDKLEEFAPVFAEHLRKQPWCERVLAGSPMETPDGIRDLQAIALPLLLNLKPAVFDETMSILQPERIQERLQRLHQQIEAGSPRPQFELEFDPLGLIAPALKPFAENNPIEEDQPLASSDRTLRVFLVVTNQRSIGAFECQRLMREVNAFRDQARDGWEGGPLEVLVTGRSAYVAEISLSMRHDIVATLLGSVLLVGIIFFAGFRRWIPLLGMGFSHRRHAARETSARFGAFDQAQSLLEHGDGGILRHSRRTRRRFRDLDIWPVSTSADRRRFASPGNLHGRPKNRARCFLRRINDSGGFSRVGPERFGRFFATRRAHRHRHRVCRALHVHDSFSVCPRASGACASRLDFQPGEKICRVERAPAVQDPDLLDCYIVDLDRVRLLAEAGASIRFERAFAGAKE